MEKETKPFSPSTTPGAYLETNKQLAEIQEERRRLEEAYEVLNTGLRKIAEGKRQETDGVIARRALREAAHIRAFGSD